MLYQVKAGIIGLDKLGMAYAELLKEHVKNLSLIAAAGRTQKELLYAKNVLSLEYVYGDEKALLENHDVDAIFILADVRFKANTAIQAIEKGKHVYILNPIALNLDDAETLLKTASSHPSQTVMCASSIRSMPLLNTLKTFIDEDKLGKINYIHTDAGFIRNLNKKHAIASGSQYLDNLLDEIELFLWLTETGIDRVEVHDSGTAKLCKLINKASEVGQFMLQREPGKMHSSMIVYGEKGKIILGNDRPFSMIYYSSDGHTEIIEVDDISVFSYPDYIQLHHFSRRILGKEKKDKSMDHALESLRLALAFEKSDVLNTPVDL